MKQIVTLLLALSVFGCSSMTVIKSNPVGAKVFIDNVERGVTPLQYSDAAIMNSYKPIRLTLEGYKPLETVIRKDKVDPKAIVGTVLFLLPVFWTLGYPEEYNFNLEKLDVATK